MQLKLFWLIIVGMAVFGALVANSSVDPRLQAGGLGLVLPGMGFLTWIPPDFSNVWTASLLALTGGFSFALSLVVWFATGNALLPPLIWLLTVVAAAWLHPGHESLDGVLMLVPAISWPVIGSAIFSTLRPRRAATKPRADNVKSTYRAGALRPVAEDELCIEDLQRMRLILDRALQPIDRFDGFDWLDQFQTAAVRYQLNFSSYALSVCQHRYLNAFDGYLMKAQKNLLEKQQDRRIWSYWGLESLWGNFDRNPDPIRCDNIMFKGFLVTQMALARNAAGTRACEMDRRLTFRQSDQRVFEYDLDQIIRILEQEYATCRFGLLPCEPNWIFPLCNAITACGIRATDSRWRETRWAQLVDRFEHALSTEFTFPNGQLVPFRSAYTGLAGASVGGAVMQTFPCLFLSPILPSLAADHWARISSELSCEGLLRSHWPVDTGNYGFSRAAGYAATAAAAAEMGDFDIRDRVLQALDNEHPTRVMDGARHRENASLWAHAVELIARNLTPAGLHDLVHEDTDPVGPRLIDVDNIDVGIARAKNTESELILVLQSLNDAQSVELRFGCLKPNKTYRSIGDVETEFIADQNGHAACQITIEGRLELRVQEIN
ncbi:MAG: hypothetical protein AAGH74_03410 [Pseudomonadota bacterium]